MSKFHTVSIALLAVGSLLGIALVGAAEGATTLTVGISATSGTTVGPGGFVSYQMIGELSGDENLGLALWSIDLHSSYDIAGGLPQLTRGPDMASFDTPAGVVNAAGYGGTPSGNDWLIQIGGGQNTPGHPGPNPPTGPVVLGIGLSPVVLATGQAHLPNKPGTYRLEISDLFGNVISGPGVGDPPWFPAAAVVPAISPSGFDVVVTPEPSTMALLGVSAVFLRRRRRRPFV